MKKVRIHTVNLLNSKTEKSVIILTDADNSMIRRAAHTEGTDINDVLRALSHAGYMSRILYDSANDEEGVRDAIGYDSVYDVYEKDQAEFEKGRDRLLDLISTIVLKDKGVKILEKDDDYMIVNVEGCAMDFCVKIEEE